MATPFGACDEFLALSALSPDQQAAVLETYERLGTEQLKPVFDAMDEKVCYDELHLLRLYYLVRDRGRQIDCGVRFRLFDVF